MHQQARPLRLFVEQFVQRPDRHRDAWLGATVRRLRQLPDASRRQVEILGADPDLLGPTRDRYSELMHTMTLGWAMQRPELARATKRALLRLLQAPSTETATNEQADSLVCTVEQSLGRFGRADICLAGPAQVFVIEGKLLAQEGQDQTLRYSKAGVELARGRTWTIAFLTLRRDQTPAAAAVHITLDQVLRAWLPVAASATSDAHRHLGRYLASLAHIYGLRQDGHFDSWGFSERRAALDFISDGRLP